MSGFGSWHLRPPADYPEQGRQRLLVGGAQARRTAKVRVERCGAAARPSPAAASAARATAASLALTLAWSILTALARRTLAATPALHAEEPAAATPLRNYLAESQLTTARAEWRSRRRVGTRSLGIAAEERAGQGDRRRLTRADGAILGYGTDRLDEHRGGIVARGIARAACQREGLATILDIAGVLTRTDHIDGKLDTAVFQCHPEKHTGAALGDDRRQPLADVGGTIHIEDEGVSVEIDASGASERIGFVGNARERNLVAIGTTVRATALSHWAPPG
jgi:hypothetical protein